MRRSMTEAKDGTMHRAGKDSTGATGMISTH